MSSDEMQGTAEGDATWQNIEGTLRTAVGTHAMLGNKALERQAREALEQFQALPKHQRDGTPAGFTDAHASYVARWGGNCRDCADESGVCPNSGLPCGGADKAIGHVFKALAYGVKQGHISNPLAQATALGHRDDAAAAELSRTTRTRLQISGWAYNLDKPCITDVERSLQVLHNTWDYCDDITRTGRTFGATPAFMRAFSDAITVMEDMAQKYADSATPQEAQAYGVVDGAAIEEARRQLLNTPELRDFSEGVTLEALHQRERWGAEHDAGKAPADWFWLVGYLAGKALHAQTSGNTEKALHHTISTAAALANWHAAITGENTAMRPGIDTAVLRVPESNV